MSVIRATRLFNSIENGALSASALNTVLQDQGRFAEFSSLMTRQSEVSRLFASPNSTTVVGGSQRAMQAVCNYPIAFYQLQQNPVALQTLRNIPTAAREFSNNHNSFTNTFVTGNRSAFTFNQRSTPGGYDILGIRRLNNEYWMFGSGGNCHKSTDLISLASVNVQFSTSNVNDMAYGNGVYVAVGGALSSSSDGTTFTERTIPYANTTLNAVIFANGQFVACGTSGSGGVIITSTDGVTWSGRHNPSNAPISFLAHGKGLYVALGYSGNTTPQIYTSPDGVTWTSRVANLDASAGVGGLVFTGEHFFACTSTGTTNDTAYSFYGITWVANGNTEISAKRIAVKSGYLIVTNNSSSTVRFANLMRNPLPSLSNFYVSRNYFNLGFPLVDRWIFLDDGVTVGIYGSVYFATV